MSLAKSRLDREGERILGYLARKGGQAPRKRVLTSGAIKGNSDRYDKVLEQLTREGKIICEAATPNKSTWIYMLPECDNLVSNIEKAVRLSEMEKKIADIRSIAPKILCQLLGINYLPKDDVVVKKVTITPATAKILLRFNTQNRPIRQTNLDFLIRSIKNGEWIMTGNAIAFNELGELIDGQHRLMAIIETNTPVTTLLAVGLDKGAFKTTDLGFKRGAHDIAALMGYKRYVAVGCAASLLYNYNNNSLKYVCKKASNTEIERILADNKGLAYSAKIGAGLHRIVAPGVATFCHYVCSQLDRDMADFFFEKLKVGTELSLKSPILLLRNKLIINRARRAVLPRHEIIALIFKAWNYFRKGKMVSVLQWRSEEPFPRAN